MTVYKFGIIRRREKDDQSESPRIPPSGWRIAKEMRACWNDLAAAHERMREEVDAAPEHERADLRIAKRVEFDEFSKQRINAMVCPYAFKEDMAERFKNAIKAAIRRITERKLAKQNGTAVDGFEAGWPTFQRTLPFTLNKRFSGGGMPIADLLKSRVFAFDRLQSREKHKQVIRARFPIGGDEFIEFSFVYHRQVDPNAIVKNIRFVGRQTIALGWEWSIVIQAEVPPRPARVSQGRVCAIDLGWRKSPRSIRVAYVSSQTESYAINCPLVYADRSVRRHNDAVRGVGHPGRIPIPTTLKETSRLAALLSGRFEVMKTAVGETLTEKPVGWSKMRERRIGRLVRDELPGDHPAVSIYREWADFHYPRRRILTRAVQRMHNSRTKVYERYVAELCRKYDEIRIEDVSVSQIIRNSIEKRKIKESDGEETRSKKRRERSSSKYRQFAAPAEFIAILRRTAERTGVRIVEMDARFTTRTCCYCGYRRAKDAGRLLTCENCGKTIDRDACATRNMLSSDWPVSTKKKKKLEAVRKD